MGHDGAEAADIDHDWLSGSTAGMSLNPENALSSYAACPIKTWRTPGFRVTLPLLVSHTAWETQATACRLFTAVRSGASYQKFLIKVRPKSWLA